MLQIAGQLIERRTIGSAQELRLHAPELARVLSPGQAVLVKCGWGREPYLRRTFYPIAIDAETWTLRVPPGGDWGHAWLQATPVGTMLDCLGPVGSGYGVLPGVRNVFCLGEGDVAWALLPALLQADSRGLAVALAMEGRSPRELIPAQRLPATVEYRTEVKMASRKPPAMTPLPFPEEWGELLRWADAVLAAGSLAFYRQLAAAIRAARYELNSGFAQVLYPATFLCGVGACQACVADVAGGRRRVCLRGPVFDLADIAV